MADSAHGEDSVAGLLGIAPRERPLIKSTPKAYPIDAHRCAFPDDFAIFYEEQSMRIQHYASNYWATECLQSLKLTTPESQAAANRAKSQQFNSRSPIFTLLTFERELEEQCGSRVANLFKSVQLRRGVTMIDKHKETHASRLIFHNEHKYVAKYLEDLGYPSDKVWPIDRSEPFEAVLSIFATWTRAKFAGAMKDVAYLDKNASTFADGPPICTPLDTTHVTLQHFMDWLLIEMKTIRDLLDHAGTNSLWSENPQSKRPESHSLSQLIGRIHNKQDVATLSTQPPLPPAPPGTGQVDPFGGGGGGNKPRNAGYVPPSNRGTFLPPHYGRNSVENPTGIATAGEVNRADPSTLFLPKGARYPKCEGNHSKEDCCFFAFTLVYSNQVDGEPFIRGLVCAECGIEHVTIPVTSDSGQVFNACADLFARRRREINPGHALKIVRNSNALKNGIGPMCKKFAGSISTRSWFDKQANTSMPLCQKLGDKAEGFYKSGTEAQFSNFISHVVDFYMQTPSPAVANMCSIRLAHLWESENFGPPTHPQHLKDMTFEDASATFCTSVPIIGKNGLLVDPHAPYQSDFASRSPCDASPYLSEYIPPSSRVISGPLPPPSPPGLDDSSQQLPPSSMIINPQQQLVGTLGAHVPGSLGVPEDGTLDTEPPPRLDIIELSDRPLREIHTHAAHYWGQPIDGEPPSYLGLLRTMRTGGSGDDTPRPTNRDQVLQCCTSLNTQRLTGPLELPTGPPFSASSASADDPTTIPHDAIWNHGDNSDQSTSTVVRPLAGAPTDRQELPVRLSSIWHQRNEQPRTDNVCSPRGARIYFLPFQPLELGAVIPNTSPTTLPHVFTGRIANRRTGDPTTRAAFVREGPHSGVICAGGPSRADVFHWYFTTFGEQYDTTRLDACHHLERRRVAASLGLSPPPSTATDDPFADADHDTRRVFNSVWDTFFAVEIDRRRHCRGLSSQMIRRQADSFDRAVHLTGRAGPLPPPSSLKAPTIEPTQQLLASLGFQAHSSPHEPEALEQRGNASTWAADINSAFLSLPRPLLESDVLPWDLSQDGLPEWDDDLDRMVHQSTFLGPWIAHQPAHFTYYGTEPISPHVDSRGLTTCRADQPCHAHLLPLSEDAHFPPPTMQRGTSHSAPVSQADSDLFTSSHLCTQSRHTQVQRGNHVVPRDVSLTMVLIFTR